MMQQQPQQQHAEEREGLLLMMPGQEAAAAPPQEEDAAHIIMTASVISIALCALAVLLFGVFVLEINPARIDAACGTGLWPLLLARVVCIVVMVALDCMERMMMMPPQQPPSSTPAALWFVDWLHLAYHIVFAIALCVVIDASGIASAKPLCLGALEEAATVTHSYALAVAACLFLAWDVFLAIMYLYRTVVITLMMTKKPLSSSYNAVQQQHSL